MKLNPAALYQAMQSKGLTQKQLAKLTGLSQPGISQYLAGTCSPGASAPFPFMIVVFHGAKTQDSNEGGNQN